MSRLEGTRSKEFGICLRVDARGDDLSTFSIEEWKQL